MTSQYLCAFCNTPIIRNIGVSQIHFCGIQCKSQWQRLRKPVTKEWLEHQYLTLGRDCTQIAHEVKRDSKSVWNWLKDFDIPTRPRGGATSPGCFSKNHQKGFKGMKHTTEFRKRMSDLAKKTGRVPYKPSVGSYMKGRRGADTPNWKGGATPDRQAFYTSDEWKECVKSVWQRDNAVCRRCGLDNRTILRGTIQFHLHHVDSFSIKERRADPSNVLLLCMPCHKWVHSKKNTRRLFLGKGH